MDKLPTTISLIISQSFHIFMLKLQSELIAHKGNVLSFLWVLGSVLMTATAGGHCVDVVLCTFSHPANLNRLSHALVRLLGRRFQTHSVANIRLKNASISKLNIKRLYFTTSFYNLPLTLADLLAVLWLPANPKLSLHPTSANSISERRQGIHLLLVHSRTIVTVFLGSDFSELKCYKPSNQMLWLISFSCEALARGDKIFLVRTGQTAHIRAASSTNEDLKIPSCCLLALLLLFLWMFLSNVALFAVVCLGWIIQEHINRFDSHGK